MNMTPQEKARQMAEAVKFCIAKGLLNEEEKRMALAGSREEKLRIGCRAILKRQLWEKARQEEDKETYNQLMNGKVIYSRPRPKN